MSEEKHTQLKCYFDCCEDTVYYIVYREIAIPFCLYHFIHYKLEPRIRVECLNKIELDYPEQYKPNIEESCKLCTKKAIYGIKGTKAEFCKDHKNEKCVKNPTTITCKYPNCFNKAIYGKKKELPNACAKHKTQEDKKTGEYKKCSEIECFNKARYNYMNHRTPIFCIRHKTEDMVSVYVSKVSTLLDRQKITEQAKIAFS